ncbi:DUF4440 domain-containing protein [Prolixibacteraceae bacterium Z1-6]|uniref:DUF4440 domain-containing protein n=1 Tax=Draconibacterium aestuarii TaxID=2998507 RepID=A0A9X3F4G0_9BACT|nr:DUF4440 domain-containing protein [Prolixibacteraceae bacterium Z1-6]
MKNLSSKVDLNAEKIAISKVIEMLVDAEIRQDADAAIEFFTDDVIVQPSDMPQIQGTKEQHELYKEFFKMPYTSFDSKSVETIIAASGDMAYDIGWNLFVFPSPDGDVDVKGKYLAVLKKVNGEWKVAALSFSNNQPAT